MAISARFNDPITTHLGQSDFFSLLEPHVTDLSKEIFKFLDRPAFLNMCAVNKHAYKILTNVHYAIPDNMEDLFEMQYERLAFCRIGNCKAHRFDWVILENSYYIRDNDVKLFQCLETHANQEKGIPPINILFRSSNSKEQVIRLSESCKRSIFALCNDLRPPEYNCADFAMESVELYNKNEINTLHGGWSFSKLNENFLNSGDIIVLNNQGEYKHFAIYLIHGIYLSKFGTNGLRAATLQDMMVAYETDAVYKMHLENKISTFSIK